MSSMKTCPSARAVIGVMGGSGLYEMEGLDHIREVELETPFGTPSDPYILGEIAGRPVAFLSRHGRGHRLLPSEIKPGKHLRIQSSRGEEDPIGEYRGFPP